MKPLVALALVVFAIPSFAQRRVDLMVDVEGVHHTGTPREFSPGTVRFEPRFDDGGGIGGGANIFVSDRVSLEAKAAALESELRIRTTGSDYFLFANLGRAKIYPLTAIVQWHFNEHGALRPYVGAGAAYVVLKNIDRAFGPASGVRFKDPVGLVVDAGVEWRWSKRWGVSGDARYVPIETSSRATFTGTNASVDVNVKPLLVSAGAVFHF